MLNLGNFRSGHVSSSRNLLGAWLWFRNVASLDILPDSALLDLRRLNASLLHHSLHLQSEVAVPFLEFSTGYENVELDHLQENYF